VFHVYRHSGDPEGGFETTEEAARMTKGLFPRMHLVILCSAYSGVIVAIRRPGASEWAFVR
jgi:hypothetical protein